MEYHLEKFVGLASFELCHRHSSGLIFLGNFAEAGSPSEREREREREQDDDAHVNKMKEKQIRTQKVTQMNNLKPSTRLSGSCSIIILSYLIRSVLIFFKKKKIYFTKKYKNNFQIYDPNMFSLFRFEI